MLGYRLSNRQKKELLVRDRVIEIAIPATADICARGDPDSRHLRDWAAARLADIAQHIRAAELCDITVEPMRGGEGLTAILGQISEPAAERLQLIVSVVAVTLCAVREPRSAALPLAWPALARSGDMTWPDRAHGGGGE